ncbi:MAG: hypothetical protein EAZ43_12175 [Betaproteobacteria bacterium]|nr:MAG: hypothetical protein EAZ43_12175 [Betaproteobacteria bacterium]
MISVISSLRMDSMSQILAAFRTTIRTNVVAALASIIGMGAAMAASMGGDAALDALIEANKPVEVERAAKERLAKNNKDEAAYWYLGMAALVQNNSKKRTAALESMDACIAVLSQSSLCHLQAGRLLGVEAMEAGLVKAMSSVGRIKNYFVRAHELDTKSFEARRDLMQFYLQAPGIAGGSESKARELALGLGAQNPEQSKLLRATIAIHEKKRDEAEQLLQSVKHAGDESIIESLQSSWITLGLSHLNDKGATKARHIFERVIRDKPQRTAGYFFLGRAQLELSEWDAAIASFKTAAQFDKAGVFATDYRLGVAFEGKGDKPQAKLAYNRALSWSKLTEKAREEVTKRIAGLS